jgi:exonuclease VII small subunit
MEISEEELEELITIARIDAKLDTTISRLDRITASLDKSLKKWDEIKEHLNR